MPPPRGIALCTVIALAACGGGGGDVHYAMAEVHRCLAGKPGVEVREWGADESTGNMLMSKAGEGELIAEWSNNELALRFERNAGDAEDTLDTKQRFNESFDVDDVPERRGNVVFEWNNTPSDAEQAALDDCLALSMP